MVFLNISFFPYPFDICGLFKCLQLPFKLLESCKLMSNKMAKGNRVTICPIYTGLRGFPGVELSI